MMVQLTEELKTELRFSSRSAAQALVDDLAYMRKLIAGTPDHGDIRRLTSQLRRILVEKDLELVAAPRVGRVMIQSPDCKPIYKLEKKGQIAFFAAGSLRIYNFLFGGHVVTNSNDGTQPNIDDYDPDAKVLLKPESYLKQNVLYLEGHWATRSETIKYIANVAHGVHTGSPRTPADILIEKARHLYALRLKPGSNDGVQLYYNSEMYFDGKILPFDISDNKVDCALLEAFAAAFHLTSSPDVHRLEEFIQSEFQAAASG